MNAITRTCTAAALTASLSIGTGGVGAAFAEDAPTPVNADQDGNPIPQAPDDADTVANGPVHPDGCPPDPSVSITKVKSTFVGDKSKTAYGQSGVTLKVEVAKGHTWTGTITYAAKLSESIIVESAEATISGSISYAKTTTVSLGAGRGKFRRARGTDGSPSARRDTPSTGSEVPITVAASGSSRITGPPSSRHSRPTSPTRELRTI